MKVLFVYPELTTIGGAEILAVRFLKAILQDKRFEVELLTLKQPQWEVYADYADIDALKKTVKVHLFKAWAGKGVLKRLFLLKMATIQRYVQSIKHEYPIIISGYNEMDCGKPAIQYLHYPQFIDRQVLVNYKMTPEDSLFYNSRLFQWLYRNIYLKVGNTKIENIQKNWTITNSKFISEIYSTYFSVASTAIYSVFFNQDSYEVLEEGFKEQQISILGRISSDKYLFEILPTLKSIVTKHPNFKINCIGKVTSSSYFEKVLSRIAELDIDINFIHDADESVKNQILLKSKYLIHPKPYEHFGLSVLEGLFAGCIPIVHNGGGVTEIVPVKCLQFNKHEDIVEIIDRIEQEPKQLTPILDELAKSASFFSSYNFDNNVLSFLYNFIKVELKLDLPISV
ncbi:MAG: glycosyltransferase [Rhodothermia bacterium]|nr:glycosyltransferase [Rhodothermia bacterium]